MFGFTKRLLILDESNQIQIVIKLAQSSEYIIFFIDYEIDKSPRFVKEDLSFLTYTHVYVRKGRRGRS